MLAAASAHIALVDREAVGLAAAASVIGPNARTFEADLGNGGSLPGLVRSVLAAFGRIEILVNCAGIRSDQPVGFHPVSKAANVVMVPSLKQALKYVNVATQTVGVYPSASQVALRNGLASGGAQRVVRLGDAGGMSSGAPHDAMYPMHRFVHWIVHEDGSAE
jgi:NAD(P)-dependent dehydrogenase (short-subunit alcohol dehydrogenase family)